MKKYLLIIALVGLLQTGCYKDKNNYVVSPINEAIIKTASEEYAVEQLTDLNITTEISYSLDRNDTYSYEWKIFESREKNDYTDRVPYGEVIANTKDLNEKIFTPAGKYVLLYTVINNNTGVRNFKELKLTVNSGFYEGLVVAYDKDDHAELGFIRKDDQIGYDLFQAMNGEKAVGTVQKVNSLVVKSLRMLALTTTVNHYQLGADEFSLLGSKNTLFIQGVNSFGDSYFGGNKMSYYDAPSDVFYINKGKIYADMGPDFAGQMAGQYSQPFYYSHGDYQLYPFLFNGKGGGNIIFYDNLNKKFLQAKYNERELYNVAQRPTDSFDPNNVGKTAVGAMLGFGGEVYYIMESGTGRDLYTMTQYNDGITNRILPINLANSPGLDKAKIFDARSEKGQIYYALDNKLYLYNVDVNAAQLIKTFGDGEQIADIHVHRANMWQNSIDEAFDKRIYIATNSGENGKVYQYQIQANGTIADRPDKEFKDFGKIVSITYRNPNE
ncbi:PKD-like family lipoprotein [Sphingobacterium paucimobilis]|uniref:PKD-like family protein n=1 Tax=Sphingobacterium paucimobilis HER1398 TaxID=1346330 RepID=U2H877_9SPHI|nr:PKD-like family lipoprotein [Sphingobacterium paucimobilis]ERJ57921.1 hypothetical protein M472_03990 [Sphingobacterium paucimobilis HER1398]